MEYIIIVLVALGASMLTFFAGFGLGTILTPAFILFLPVELAVAATAIVHFLNNLFKLTLIGKQIDWQVTFKFGLPAIVGAYFGAQLLGSLSRIDASVYILGIETTTLNMLIALLILFFSLFELIPKLSKLQLHTKWLIPGGLISGFFGGLSGHQGALRSAFLLKTGLNKASFIATGVMIACLIDTIRISTYLSTFNTQRIEESINLILLATVSAFIGAIIGKQLLKKVTIHALQNLVGVLMMIIAVMLFFGLI